MAQKVFTTTRGAPDSSIWGAVEWLSHAKMDTTMKKDAIDKATSEMNPIFSNGYDVDWENDEELLKRLYGLK